MTAVTGISTITSNYGHLNGVQNAYYGNYGYGLGGYGGYGYGGVYNTANAEQAKERIANSYDVNATQQGYRSKQGVETINYTQQCNTIAQDLKNGETDQVSERFQEMVSAMKNSPQYANYSTSEICSLIRDQYATATGSDLVVDINSNASNPFIQGFKRGIPVFGILAANKNSSSDLVAQVTNNDQSRGEKSARILGTTAGAATGAGAIAGVAVAAHKYKLGDKIAKLYKSLPSGGKASVLATAGVAGVALLASLIGSLKPKSKTNN